MLEVTKSTTWREKCAEARAAKDAQERAAADAWGKWADQHTQGALIGSRYLRDSRARCQAAYEALEAERAEALAKWQDAKCAQDRADLAAKVDADEAASDAWVLG